MFLRQCYTGCAQSTDGICLNLKKPHQSLPSVTPLILTKVLDINAGVPGLALPVCQTLLARKQCMLKVVFISAEIVTM